MNHLNLLVGVFLLTCGPGDVDAAVAEANRLDPGWQLTDLLAAEARRKPADDRNSALFVHRVLDQLPEKWLQAEPGASDRTLDTEEIPRGLALYNAVNALSATAPIAPNIAKGLRAELEALAPAVTTARTLVEFPDGFEPITPAKDPYATLLPYTQNCRQVGRLLFLDAMRLANEGKADEAIDSVRAMLNVGRSLGAEPSLISQLVRMSIDSLAVETLMHVLGRCEPSDHALALLQAEILRELVEPRFLNGLRGERAMYFDLLDKLATGALTDEEIEHDEILGDVAKALVKIPRPLREAFYRRNQGLGLKMMNQAVELARRPLHEQPPFWKDWNDKLLGLRKSTIQGIGNAVVLLLLPAVDGGCAADQRIATKLGSTAVAIAAERYRREAGRWPESQDALVPKYLDSRMVDAYSGDPLRVVRQDDDLLIYGLGEDKVDNGGNFSPRNLATADFDVGVRLFDPAHRVIRP